MASNQKWREEFIARMFREGLRLETIWAVLRYAATLQRLAEAQCNGDWPADNGQRETTECTTCGSSWVPSVLKSPSLRCMFCQTDTRKTAGGSCPERVRQHGDNGTGNGDLPCQRARICPDCRTADLVRLVRAALAGSGWVPVFQGDPRGCVVKVARLSSASVGAFIEPSGQGNGWVRCADDTPGCFYFGVDCGDTFVTSGQQTRIEALIEQVHNGRAESRGDVVGVPA